MLLIACYLSKLLYLIGLQIKIVDSSDQEKNKRRKLNRKTPSAAWYGSEAVLKSRCRDPQDKLTFRR